MKRKVLIALVCAAVCLLLAGTALAVSSSDLGQFLTSVTITSVPGNNNDNYDIELEFAETEALQFDNDVSLLYTFPAGITIPEDSNTQTAISFSTNDTTYVVSGNAVQVDTSGNMTVRSSCSTWRGMALAAPGSKGFVPTRCIWATRISASVSFLP